MGSCVGAGNLWPCQSLPRWEMRPGRQVRQGHVEQPVKHARLKFPDLAVSSWISLFSAAVQSWPRYFIFLGGKYTHLDSWRELDDEIVTSSWLAYLNTKTENRTKQVCENFKAIDQHFRKYRLFVFLPRLWLEDWYHSPSGKYREVG